MLKGLGDGALQLLRAIDGATGPVTVTRSDTTAARQLEHRLLTHITDVHTETGAHGKAYLGWEQWGRNRAVCPCPDSDLARNVFESVVDALELASGRKILPW